MDTPCHECGKKATHKFKITAQGARVLYLCCECAICHANEYGCDPASYIGEPNA